ARQVRIERPLLAHDEPLPGLVIGNLQRVLVVARGLDHVRVHELLDLVKRRRGDIDNQESHRSPQKGMSSSLGVAVGSSSSGKASTSGFGLPLALVFGAGSTRIASTRFPWKSTFTFISFVWWRFPWA